MKRFRDETELRQYVEKKLGPLSEEIWGLLKDDNYISEVLSGNYEDSLRNLLERAKRLRQLAGRHSKRETERTPTPPDMSYLIRSRLLAVEAAKLPLVRQFRRKYLPNGLLSLSEVTPWIEARAKEDGPPSLYVTVAVPPGVLADDKLCLAEAVPAGTRVVRSDRETLCWIDADMTTRWRFIADGGTLHFLQTTARWLAGELGCSEAQAATLILTGIPPLLTPVVLKYDVNYSLLGTRETITMTIGLEVSPMEVAKIYSQERSWHIAGKWRPPSPKTLEMVSFRLDHLGMSWRECWEAWNAEHPDKRYPSPERMKRDYHRAVKRILEGVPIRRTKGRWTDDAPPGADTRRG